VDRSRGRGGDRRCVRRGVKRTTGERRAGKHRRNGLEQPEPDHIDDRAFDRAFDGTRDRTIEGSRYSSDTADRTETGDTAREPSSRSRSDQRRFVSSSYT